LAGDIIRHRVNAAPDAAHADFVPGFGKFFERPYSAWKTVGSRGELDVICAEEALENSRGGGGERAVSRNVGRERGRAHVGDEIRMWHHVRVQLWIEFANPGLGAPRAVEEFRVP